MFRKNKHFPNPFNLVEMRFIASPMIHRVSSIASYKCTPRKSSRTGLDSPLPQAPRPNAPTPLPVLAVRS